MTDTDKLIAAIFAATMTAKQNAPLPRDFFAFYDACLAEAREREAAMAERKIADQNKAWG